MRFQLLVAISAAAVSASPTWTRGDHVVHERRSKLPSGWTKREAVKGDFVLPLRVGLRQSNLDRAEEFLDKVSNPTSADYGKHWTAKEVVDMFAPRFVGTHVFCPPLHFIPILIKP